MTEANPYPALPPRPEPQTGEPFPPHGRAFKGIDRAPELNRSRETRLSHKPDPPPGMGPALVWHKESKRGKVTTFVGSFALLFVGGSLIAVLDGGGPFDWMGAWQLWAIILVTAYLITGPLTYVVLSAGADWFQATTVRFGVRRKTTVIRFYELREIKADFAGVTWWLTLMGDEGGIHLALHEWQYDRRMWDLVYNGILHSVAAGAECPKLTRQLLELDHIEELRFPEGAREIDLTRLSDSEVRKVMNDGAAQRAMRVIKFTGGPEEFRRQFSPLTERMLDGPVDPKWFPPSDDPEQDIDDRWQRFYRGR